LLQLAFGWLNERAIGNVASTYRNCPAWLLRALFSTITLIQFSGQWFGFYPENETIRYAMMFPAFRRWLDGEIPIAGKLFYELGVNVFQKNLLARGEMKLSGEIVDLHRIGAPLLNVIAERDALVPPASSLPLLDLVGSKDKMNLMFPGGHIGVAVSPEAHVRLWPQIGAWLGVRDD
jgi:polyhydroxyalkanoate synthase